MTSVATDHDERPTPQRKSTLFCWDCDHASPVDDDWVRRRQNRHVEYRCPDCDTTVAKRPLSEEFANERATAGPTVAWRHALHNTVGLWHVSVGIGLSNVAAIRASLADTR